ncbi:response regulator [Halomicrobium salinisoli]|uniref:response regulator n=1 Tax=Halomicrobium salinisoli TaxID=2878391 RepID=UPI001CF03D7E|nr:response regulator [Halomicrobium salinisoli]
MTGTHSGGTGRAFDVLLVERDPGAVAPFIDSFRATEATEEVHVVTDGAAALDYVHGRGEYEAAPRPDLIVLDPDVPGADGERLLAELDDRSGLRSVPVLVFTSSDAAEDVARSYELNANAYLRKPTGAEEFEELARAIEDFWLRMARLPPK